MSYVVVAAVLWLTCVGFGARKLASLDLRRVPKPTNSIWQDILVCLPIAAGVAFILHEMALALLGRQILLPTRGRSSSLFATMEGSPEAFWIWFFILFILTSLASTAMAAGFIIAFRNRRNEA